MRSARRELGAFTLLEVLAAVAILALVYTVLARVGIQGFRAEGGSDRRLRASLLADQVMAEVETQLEKGVAPELGEKVAPREDFEVRLKVTPSELELPARSDAATQRIQAAAAAKTSSGVSASAGKPGANGPPPSFFQPVGPGQPPPGRRIEVRVSWVDGATESDVVRETYGLDQSAAKTLLDGLDSAAKAEAQAAAGGAAVGNAPAGTSPVPGTTPTPQPPSSSPGMGSGPMP
jgi:prepilin-type N-terminal cleavage/methylation domain-containing protein